MNTRRIRRQLVDEDMESMDATLFLQTEMSAGSDDDYSPPNLKPYHEQSEFEQSEQQQLGQTRAKSNGGIQKKREYRDIGESFSCPTPTDVTETKSRKKKRFRSNSVTKCDYCDFKTQYAWNLRRHVLGHRQRAENVCPLCSFSADKNRSIIFHLEHHHSSFSPEEIKAIVLEVNSQHIITSNLDMTSSSTSNGDSESQKPRHTLPTMKMMSNQLPKLFNRWQPMPSLIPISPRDGGDNRSTFEGLPINPVWMDSIEQRKPQAGVGTWRKKQRKFESLQQSHTNMAYLKKKMTESPLKEFNKGIGDQELSIQKNTLGEKTVNKKMVTIPQPARESMPVKMIGQSFTCSNCPTQFKSYGKLKIHRAYHLRESTFKCDFCNYSVDVLAVLLLHKRAHNDISATQASSAHHVP